MLVGLYINFMPLFNTEEQEAIANAISTAENKSSGEIRIAIEKKCASDPIERAKVYFFKLGMEKTAQRNGVLIYLAYEDRKFAIIGDNGINNLVSDDFWETTQIAMKAHFKAGNISQGLIAGITIAGEQLALFFPHRPDDINEISNEIVYLDKL